MPEPASKPDAIDSAIAQQSRLRTLDEIVAGVEPIQSWDDLAIPGLTDEEWEAFEAALKDE
jgi:hypothetical protein